MHFSSLKSARFPKPCLTEDDHSPWNALSNAHHHNYLTDPCIFDPTMMLQADGKEVGTSGGDEPQKPEIAELGSASGQALEGPGTSDKQGQNLHDRGSQRRRRGRTRDQQKRECLKEFETMCNESSSHRLEARSFASSVRLAAQERQQRHLFPLRPPLMSCNGLRN